MHRNRERECNERANVTQDVPKGYTIESEVTEFAGSVSTRSSDFLDPSTPFQPNADFDWIADSGATSHMTLHRAWVRNYKPQRIPIMLADGSVIYAAGVGTVVFNPVVNGKRIRSVEITRVLHVPELRNNLLSCLYLTRNKAFTIHVDSQ